MSNAAAHRTDLTIANTIVAQLGGHRFVVMTGARNFVGSADGVTFRIGTGAKDGINCVRIAIDPWDRYTVTFYKLGRLASVTEVRTLSDVYADDLRRIFTEITGLDTRL